MEAVSSERLIAQSLAVAGSVLIVGDEEIPLDSLGRIVVVGAGKAGAGMAAAVEEVLGPRLIQQKHVAGWVNVPDDCARPLKTIRLHGARPAGVNEPAQAGADGAAEILRLVESLGPRDLCLALISGGGSALLPAPVAGVSLADKLAVTRHLSAAGANIEELNTVRKQLSRIKGGGLARACRAGRLVSLIISDVLGDPLDVISSGPTVRNRTTDDDALAVLKQFDPKSELPASVYRHLQNAANTDAGDVNRDSKHGCRCGVTNLVIGNNALAVDAAGMEAERLGYSHAMQSAAASEGYAEDVGRHLAQMALSMRGGQGRNAAGPNCLISGGEPVVKLADAAVRGQGGRNQQLVLAALEFLAAEAARRGYSKREAARGIAILSGGTDGEDGPTDAAGAFLDENVLAAALDMSLDAADYLRRNDAYNFFKPLDALVTTGPTHTNVCDVRVVLVELNLL